MAKDPAFLFYSQDFIVGVQTMPYEDRGKYITILCQMHQQGRMDEETIRFIVGSISDKLKAKFRIDEKGFWYNDRLEQETVKRNNFTESRRLNGSLGGRPKNKKPKAKAKQNHMHNHKANLMGNVNDNVNDNNNTKEYDFSKPDIGGDEIIFPIDTQPAKALWAKWKEYRWTEHGSRYGMMGEQADLKRLDRMTFPQMEETILKAIAGNWKNLYPNKDGKRNIITTTKTGQSSSTADYLKQHYSAKAQQ